MTLRLHKDFTYLNEAKQGCKYRSHPCYYLIYCSLNSPNLMPINWVNSTVILLYKYHNNILFTSITCTSSELICSKYLSITS